MQMTLTVAYDNWLYGYDYKTIIGNIIACLFYIYPQTALVLYLVITYASAKVSTLTYQQMNYFKEQNEEISVRKSYDHLKKWKLRQESVNETVEATNYCFGFVLLFGTYSVFLSFVNTTFYIFCGIMDGESIPLIMTLVSLVLNYSITLSIISFPADYLASKVS